MKPINVEITMGHNIGLSGSYYRPSEREILDDYLIAVDLLTINEENRLKNKVEKLEIEKSRIDLMSSQIEEIQKTKLLFNLNRNEEAINYYDRALEIDPEMLEALFNKGLLLYAEDKKEEALTWIDKALIIDPTNQ
jgi:tetratricopeptide (TPR) repeat protein